MSKYIVFIFFLLVSCTRNNEQQFVNFDNIEELTHTSAKNFRYNFDYLIDFIDDYLILVNFQGDHVLSIYDKHSYTHLLSGISFGKGSNEILTPTHLNVDKEKREFSILDSSNDKLLIFSIDSIIIYSKFNARRRIRMPRSSGEFRYPALPISSGKYLCMSWAENFHFIYFNKEGKVLENFGSFPVEKQLSNIPDIMAGAYWEGRYEVSEKLGRAFKACLYHDRISAYDLNNSAGSELWNVKTSANRYKKISFNGNGIDITDRRFCYVSTYITDKYFYGLYHGGPTKNSPEVLGKEIHIFDYNGNPVKKLLLDVSTTDIAVDEQEKKIYGINYTLDNPILTFSYF